ncbi:MAG: NAD(P)/FAD-dependent oxidoreductase [archaeon]|nr:NAD(P)/FAD-dependent oxidoreductase [archaeon]
MVKEYDLIVIGTGAAGTTVAFECSSAGRKVAIVDSSPFGGTCALRGCDPKKILVGGAEIIDRSLSMRGRGIAKEIEINWPELMRFKRTFTDPVPESRGKSFSEAGIDAFQGRASFTGKNTLKIGDEILIGRYITVATGAKPRNLNILGEEYITTSDQFLERDTIPESITFIGGGYISFELSHVAARAGAHVRILHRSKRPLKNFDPDLVDMLIKASQDLGIEIHLNMPVDSIEKKNGKLVVHAGENKNEFESDMVVHGAGRVPAIADLNLEKAEIEADKRGFLVNEYLQSA